MASFATSCVGSVRVVARQLTPRRAQLRAFRTSRKVMGAQNFPMPALSPTMQEGNIAKWALKEGDSFSAGDVLLQVETDKAQMDVEAQDDGILVKIMQPDGTSSVKVGTRIAVLADPDDDISSLEIPPETSSSSSSDSQPAAKEEKSETKEAKESSSQQPSTDKHTPSTFPPSPSVMHLLHTHSLNADEIRPTGPNNRLLKGDVLAHMGRIPAEAPRSLADMITKHSHLDLSNIKPAPKPPQEKAEAKAPAQETEKTTKPPTAPATTHTITLPISLAPLQAHQARLRKTLGAAPPLDMLLARAAAVANADVAPRPKRVSPRDALFDEIVGVGRGTGRPAPFAPQVLVERGLGRGSTAAAARGKGDVFDEILGVGERRRGKGVLPIGTGGPAEESLFCLDVKEWQAKRGMAFLERMKSIVESETGKLVNV